jgi:hypothetical protein
LTESCEAAIHLGTYLAVMGRNGIAEMFLATAMTPLLGVHIRRLRRQPFQRYLRMRRGLLLDDDGPRRAAPLPDDEHRPVEVPLAMSQGHPHSRRPDGVLNMPLVDPAGPRHANDRGQLAALTHAPQNGRLPLRSPGRGRLGAKREPDFIDEDDSRTSAARLVLIRRQSWVTQAYTRASSRSRVYTAGRCGL